MMSSLADRFRRWYEYERDCNAKSLGMLESVPEASRGRVEYQKALDKFAHMIAARRRWLHRLGHWPHLPETFPHGVIAELPALNAETEAAWVQYLSALDDAELAREIEWELKGRKFRVNVEAVLTQTFGHAWYHRGQIAQLVAGLGGTAVDTDYIFWHLQTPEPTK